jgi:hypothetical protein
MTPLAREAASEYPLRTAGVGADAALARYVLLLVVSRATLRNRGNAELSSCGDHTVPNDRKYRARAWRPSERDELGYHLHCSKIAEAGKKGKRSLSAVRPTVPQSSSVSPEPEVVIEFYTPDRMSCRKLSA